MTTDEPEEHDVVFSLTDEAKTEIVEGRKTIEPSDVEIDHND